MLSPKCLDYIEGDMSSWEGEPLAKIAEDGQLMALNTGGSGNRWTRCVTRPSSKNSANRESPLEVSGINPDFWKGKRVFITGHTGFKGGWLSLWLQSLGAEVHRLFTLASDQPEPLFRCPNWRGNGIVDHCRHPRL